MFKVPGKEELLEKRAVKIEQLNPTDDNWNGWIGKDKNGIYSFEAIQEYGCLEDQKGEKFYIEEFYEMVENRIIESYQKAKEIMKRLDKNYGKKAIDMVMRLIKIDCVLVILNIYHSNPPSGRCFLSARQLEEVLATETSLDFFIEYLSAINSTKKTPLGIGSLLKKHFTDNPNVVSLLFLCGSAVENINTKYCN